MDEENRNENQNNNKIVDAARDAAKQKGKNLAKNAVSAALKGIAKIVIAHMVPIIIALVVILVLTLFYYSIVDKAGDVFKSTDELFTSESYSIDYKTGEIEVSDEFVSKIVEQLTKEGLDLDGLKLLGDIDYSDPDNEEKNKEALGKYIKRFYETQLMTETINTTEEGKEKEGKSYGSVRVYNELGKQMEYTSYEKLQKLVESGKVVDAGKYYSIDDSGRLAIICETKTTVYSSENTIRNSSYQYRIETADYKNAVSQYSTPANFFIYLAIITQNPRFVTAVTDLVQRAEISITVLKNSTTETTTVYESYTQCKQEYNGVVDTQVEKKDVSNKFVSKQSVRTETLKLAITFAKTWFSEETIQYNGNTVDETTSSSTDPVSESKPTEYDPTGDVLNWKENYVEKIQIETSTKTYEKGASTGVQYIAGEKGSKGLNSEGQIDENTTFVGLLDDKFKLPNSSRKESAGGNLVSGAEWLFHLMQKDETQQHLEELMRYILFRYTGIDYGVTELDLNVFGAKEFTSINGIYGGDVKEKVWFTLKDAGYSEYAVAGVMGNIQWESDFNPSKIEGGYNENNGGIGLCQWTNDGRGTEGRNTNLKAFAQSRGTTWQDENLQIEFLLGELNTSGGADGYAYCGFMSTVKFYSGTHFNSNYGTRNSWLNATSVEMATEAFMISFERPKKTDTSLPIRIKSAIEYYNEFHGKERSDMGGSYEANKNGGIVVGYFTAANGRKFTILNQNRIPGWGSCCNRAAQASVCSGYMNKTPQQLVDQANKAPNLSCPCYTAMYSECGLKCSRITSLPAKYTYPVQNIRAQLQSGGYIILYVRGKNVGSNGISKYGRDWATSMHWVAILGYRNETGKEEIFVSDSGHNLSGWRPIDEFDGITDKVVLVNEK